MSRPAGWRLLDTGLRRAGENIALNRALLEAHQAGGSPHTLRFLRFEPSALIGFHQSVAQELRAGYCAAHGIAIQRRITGGGAIYFEPAQIGWELYLDRNVLGTADMGAIAGRVCEMAARGISALGVAARYRPRNDIEVDGRKISGTGGAFDGDSILYQGTLLVDFDIERMLNVLRIPAEKLLPKAIASARERVTTLKALLGDAPPLERIQNALAHAFAEGFGVELEPGGLTQEEQHRFGAALAEIDAPEWIYQTDRPAARAPVVEGVHKAEGGLLRAALAVDPARNRIKQAWFTGDFFVNPRRLVADLEGALRDSPLDGYRRTVESFFRGYPAEMLLLNREDFIRVIERALEARESLEELGAGFALASHDLEIRGAGELLGEQQSGEIDEVGFALYSELLERAVRSLRTGEKLPAKTESREVEINLHAPALLPEPYLPDVHMRLVLYKRIASAESLEALQALQEEIVDRFGVLPDAGKRLFRAAELKIRAAPLGIRKIDAGAKGARIEFVEKPPIDPGAIIRLLQSAPRTYRLDGPNRLRIVAEMPDAESRVKTITKLFDTLAPARIEAARTEDSGLRTKGLRKL